MQEDLMQEALDLYESTREVPPTENESQESEWNRLESLGENDKKGLISKLKKKKGGVLDRSASLSFSRIFSAQINKW
jgi:hypothetical protein